MLSKQISSEIPQKHEIQIIQMHIDELGIVVSDLKKR